MTATVVGVVLAATLTVLLLAGVTPAFAVEDDDGPPPATEEQEGDGQEEGDDEGFITLQEADPDPDPCVADHDRAGLSDAAWYAPDLTVEHDPWDANDGCIVYVASPQLVDALLVLRRDLVLALSLVVLLLAAQLFARWAGG